ncbi:MAG: TetR/AcrR family transcriptional regulator [Candidatus Thorarchaeota archaeon]
MSPKVSQEYKKRIRNSILEAAENQFSKQGYYETSMDDIVNASGLSKGAIYGYFDSKESLFLAIQEKQSILGLQNLEALLSNERSSRSKLEKAASIVFGTMCEVSEESCRMDLEFQVASSRLRKIRNRLKNQYMTIVNFIANIIREGIQNSEFRPEIDPDLAATILVSSINGLSTLNVTTGVKLDWEKIKRTYIDIAMNGLV